MSFFRDKTQGLNGRYYPVPATTFGGTTPAAGTNFNATSGTNSTYATFQAFGFKGNSINYRVSGLLPTGITLNPRTGVLSGTEPLLTYGNIGSTNTDTLTTNNNITLSATGGYANPVKNYSFTVTAEEYDPSLTLIQSVSRSYTMTLTTPWKFRQIITRGFTISGYRNSVTFRSCNRTTHSNDTTVNLGDLTDRSFNYKGAAVGLSVIYSFGTTNAHAATSNHTSAFNMRTETQFGNRMNSNKSVGMPGVAFHEYYWAWMTGGGNAATEEYNLMTETRTSNNIGNILAGVGGATAGLWAMNGENFTIFYDGSNQRTFTHATRTSATRSAGNPSNNHQQKSVQSKNGVAWAGGNGTYNGGFFFRQTNMVTNTLTSSNSGNKPIQNCGEENPDIGQDHQYVIGTFDGAQNNRSWRFNYATGSGFEGGASMQSKGVPGRSSGTNGWCDF